MRTELAVVIALAAAPAVARAEGPAVAALGAEASVIGESYGPRAEVLWRVGAEGRASHLRAAVGALTGPELDFVPISLGYRAVWRTDRTVQPFAGGGYEQQHFRVAPGQWVHRWLVLYAEGGVAFAVAPGVSLGLAASLDVALLRDNGAGLQLRGFAAWRF